MANKNDDTANRVSITTYGMGNKLDKDSDDLSNIIKQTTSEIEQKFGQRTGTDDIINNFTNANLSYILNPKKDNKTKTNSNSSDVQNIESILQNNSQSAISIMSAEQGRIIDYSNYKSINDNIPECATALETYVSNILSPDDYTKSIFSIQYNNNSADSKESENIIQKTKLLIKKYNIEEKTDQIVHDTLEYGDCYVAVLPYDNEIKKMLKANGGGTLMESSNYHDLNNKYHYDERNSYQSLNESDIDLDVKETSALEEYFSINTSDTKNATTNKNKAEDMVLRILNEHVQVGSVTDFYKDRVTADDDINQYIDQADIDTQKLNAKNGKNVKSKKGKYSDIDSLNISGSYIKSLDPSRVVELTVEDVCYGYYYIEEGITANGDITSSSVQYSNANNNDNSPMNPSLLKQGTEPRNTASGSVAQHYNISDEKLHLISGIFLKGLSKKLNKDYIKDNKELKDIIYSLLKQEYLLQNGIKITYLLPSEVVHFKTESIFKNIVFFAKLYLATLTNRVLINLGRGHDKRIFYVNTGLDNNHEQAIEKVITDVKTKEFKMSNLGTISSLLSLNPGAFDDYYMPVVNGEKPVNIDTIQGMDQPLNTDEFMQFLRRSMMDGTGVPNGIIEANDDISFAKQISTQNANFCRKIIRIQNKLTGPFSTFIKILYKNEYSYTMDSNAQPIDISNLTVKFPTPISLGISNQAEQFGQADQVAEYIAKSFIPEKQDLSSSDEIQAFKQQVIRKLMPQVEWDEYEKLYDEFEINYKKEKELKKITVTKDSDNQGNF